MVLEKHCVIALVAIIAMLLGAGSVTVVAQESSPEFSPGLHTGWMMETYGGYNGTWSCNRTYEYHVPSSYDGSEAVPLLFVFHGMGGSGDMCRDVITAFDGLAEQEGFIAVFPDATTLTEDDNPCAASLVGKYNPILAGPDLTQWNIGLNWSLQYCAGVDDVGFVSHMVDWFKMNCNIDESRIYAVGMSNGAMLSNYLALMLPGTFAGIGPICGPLTTNTTWPDVSPLTVIMMMGAADPIVSYDGSPLVSIYSVDDAVTFWLDVDDIASEPLETVWGPTLHDSTVVHRYVYGGGTDGTQVILFKVERGGHTWPGGPVYSPVVGAVTTHIDGSALMWKHLPPEKYYLKISSTLGGDVTTPAKSTFANVESTGAYMFFYPENGDTLVNLEAMPKSDSWEFANWTGDVSTIADVNAATTTITVTPDRDYEITANFQVKSEEPEPEPEPEPTPSGGMCFIATAAFDTPMAEEIQILREFRDEYLLTNTVGQSFVDFYYKTSPPVAKFITEHPSLKPIVRAGLLPALAISALAVNAAPAEKTTIASVLMLGSLVLVVWAIRRRGRPTGDA